MLYDYRIQVFITTNNQLFPMKSALKGAAVLQQQRMDVRTDAFMRAAQCYDDRTAKLRGWAAGRTESGMPMPTRQLGLSGVFVDKWYVNMPLRREDHAKLSDNWRDTEAQIKAGGVPRATLRMHLHIIRAVRLLKHIREGYRAELDAAVKLLAPLDQLNLKLAKTAPCTGSQLASAIGRLQDFRDSELVRKRSALKRIVAMGRLEETMRLLQNTLGLGGNARTMEISRACAQFVAFRGRLGEWRDKQIAGIAVRNFKKECALRVERDRWLLAQLDRFATSLEKIYEYDLFDIYKRYALIGVHELLEQGAPKEMVLMQLRATHQLFRVPERKREDVAEAGLLAADRKVDYLIAHYGWLYRYVSSGQTGKALAKLGFLSSFVNANKPIFILRELSEDADKYLGPVLQKLGTAVAIYKSIHGAEDVKAAFVAAKVAFAAARDELKKIVRPEIAR